MLIIRLGVTLFVKNYGIKLDSDVKEILVGKNKDQDFIVAKNTIEFWEQRKKKT